MELTVPDGWLSREQDAGEFNLWPVGRRDSHLFMVRDISAVHTDGSMALAPGIGRTPEALAAYWQTDPNLDVSPPTATTIAGGVAATTYIVTVSPGAAFTDRGCPAYPRCADMFTDVKHWGGGVYGIGGDAVVRLSFATVGSGSNAHLLVVGLEGDDPAALARLSDAAASIIDSIRLPASFPTY